MLNLERTVLEANLSFYEAIASHDLTAMEQIWASAVEVVCIHPGWQVLYGREQVLASWRAIFSSEHTAIRCEQARALVLHDVAVVTCIELVQDVQLAATNVFVLDSGVWHMVHHQAAPFATRPLPQTPLPPRGSLN